MSRLRIGCLASTATMLAAVGALVVLTGWVTPVSAAQPHWTWPLSPRPTLVAPFDLPDDPWGSGHRGIDLQGRPGQPVLAVAAGTVTFAGRIAGQGVVVVKHGAVRSTYEPVLPAVDVGDHVEAADPIANLTIMSSHCLPEACLHLGARRGDTYLDPMDFLGGRPIRLKPLDDGVHAGGSAARPIPTSVRARGPQRDRPDGQGRGPWGLGLGVAGAVGLAVAVVRRAAGHARG